MRHFTFANSVLLITLFVLGFATPTATRSSAAICTPYTQPNSAPNSLCQPAFAVDEQLFIRPGVPFVWLRQKPSSSGVVIGIVYPSNSPNLQVVDSAQVWDGYQWWYDVTSLGNLAGGGWVEQASLSAPATLPIPTVPKANWLIPMTATLKSGVPFAWLRADPNSSAPNVDTLYPRNRFVVDASPAAVYDGVQWWWYISASGATGWLEQASIVPNTGVPPTPTSTPTKTADDGIVDLGTVSVPAGLTGSLNVTGLKGWSVLQVGQSGVQWRWEGVPSDVSITDMNMPAPFERIFYLTPSTTTVIGSYPLTLYATSGTKHWVMRVGLNVLGCHETFQSGIYTLKTATDAASTYFSFGGPDAWRAGVGDQRWFTFCASSQKRQLTLTLLAATGKTDSFSVIPKTISFYRSASWPLPSLSTTPLSYITVNGEKTNNNGKVFTWTVQPGAYIVFFLSNGWGQTADPSVTVTYSATLAAIA